MLSPRLSLKVAQKQILTPGLVQMVTVLQLNRLELKEMIAQEIARNPVLDEVAEGGEELTPQEIQSVLEAERDPDPADRNILEGLAEPPEAAAVDGDFDPSDFSAPEVKPVALAAEAEAPEVPEAKTESDPFEEIDFGSFFEIGRASCRERV